MADKFSTFGDSPMSPSRDCYGVTPHDSNALASLPKALFIGTGGDVVLRSIDSSADVTLKNVADGQVLDIRASHVRATGTTATDIVALG